MSRICFVPVQLEDEGGPKVVPRLAGPLLEETIAALGFRRGPDVGLEACQSVADS
jgi:hypothetical protein